MKQKRGTRRQSRATTAQREHVVRQFQGSGLSCRDFSRQYGVPLSTLGRWLGKKRRKADYAPPVVFSEVRLVPSEEKPSNSWAMEIVGPGGMTIRCRELLPVEDLKRLLDNSTC